MGVYTTTDALIDVGRVFLDTAPEDRSGEDRTLVVVHISAELLNPASANRKRSRGNVHPPRPTSATSTAKDPSNPPPPNASPATTHSSPPSSPTANPSPSAAPADSSAAPNAAP